jgi:hypothetical protein
MHTHNQPIEGYMLALRWLWAFARVYLTFIVLLLQVRLGGAASPGMGIVKKFTLSRPLYAGLPMYKRNQLSGSLLSLGRESQLRGAA